MNFLVGLFTELAGVVGGMLNGVLGNTVAIMKSGIETAQAFHQEGISLARDLGMGLNQANAYTKVLAERTMDLASKYGVAKEAIIAVQRNLSETTGKQLMLNDAQAESFVQANKLIGEGTTNEFIDNIMNGMGGQVSAVEKAISKAYATASKQGLNAKKFSKTVADNLSMANRLNFRNGVDGIAKMAAMSEKLGLNLKDVETAANKFMDLDSAIESSAHLQMLGGSIGASFGNPLTNAYESMYDPEAFAERMENAIKGMASFDESKGYATVSPINQEILANYANEMGLSKEDVIKNAKKQAEANYKEQRFGGKLNSLGLSEEQKNFLINNGQIKNGELYYTDAHGGEHNVSRNDVNGDLINEMMQFSNMSDSDLMKSQAASLTSIEEALKGSADATGAAFARGLGLEERAKGIKDVIHEVGKTTKDIAGHLGGAVGKAMDGISNFIMTHKDTFKKIAEGITKMFGFLTEHWKLLLGVIVGFKAAKFLGNIPGGRKLGAKAAKVAWSGIKSGANWLKELPTATKGLGKEAKSFFSYVKDGFKESRQVGNGFFTSLKDAFRAPEWKAGARQWRRTITNARFGGHFVGGANSSVTNAAKFMNRLTAPKQKLSNAYSKVASGYKKQWNNAGKLGKVTMVGGAVAGVAAGIGDVVGALSDYKKTIEDINNSQLSSEEKRKAIEEAKAQRNSEIGGGVGEAVGGVVGAFFGPIGAFIGPVVGKFIGSFIGQYWNPIVNGVKSLFSSVKDGIKYVGGVIWDGIKFLIDNNPIGLMVKGIGKIFGKDWSITKGISAVKDWIFGGEKQADGGIVGAKPKETLIENHAIGGIVGGNSYSGDRILTGLNSGEMVLNKNQQAALFNFINEMPSVLSKIGTNGNVSYYTANRVYENSTSSNATKNVANNIHNTKLVEFAKSVDGFLTKLISPLTSVLTNSNDVKAKPVGGKEYIYVPSNGNGGLNGVSEITVKDINLNINGTLKLDAGSLTNTLDIRQLLSDTSFISQMKDLIKESINNDINNGRFMNDMASMRGMPSQVGLWGLK